MLDMACERLPRSHDKSAGKKGDRMSQVVIENPIINSPFDEPIRHFRFSDEGITNEIDDGRRNNSGLRA